jgi:hypothetical protein
MMMVEKRRDLQCFSTLISKTEIFEFAKLFRTLDDAQPSGVDVQSAKFRSERNVEARDWIVAKS